MGRPGIEYGTEGLLMSNHLPDILFWEWVMLKDRVWFWLYRHGWANAPRDPR